MGVDTTTVPDSSGNVENWLMICHVSFSYLAVVVTQRYNFPPFGSLPEDDLEACHTHEDC